MADGKSTACNLCARNVIAMLPIAGPIICAECLAKCSVVTPRGTSSVRLEAGAEVLQAARLWDRMVTIWESDDGTPSNAYDPEIMEKIGTLMNEWQLPPKAGG